MRRTCLALLLALSGCGPDSQDMALRRCREQAEACGAALVAKDFDKFADLTYPKLVEILGGRTKMVALLAKSVKDARFEVIALKVEAPSRFIIAGSDVLAVVPITRETLDSGKKTAGRSFFLGVSSDQGQTWTFLDGTNLDNQKLKQILPHFPPGVRLP